MLRQVIVDQGNLVVPSTSNDANFNWSMYTLASLQLVTSNKQAGLQLTVPDRHQQVPHVQYHLPAPSHSAVGSRSPGKNTCMSRAGSRRAVQSRPVPISLGLPAVQIRPIDARRLAIMYRKLTFSRFNRRVGDP